MYILYTNNAHEIVPLPINVFFAKFGDYIMLANNPLAALAFGVMLFTGTSAQHSPPPEIGGSSSACGRDPASCVGVALGFIAVCCCFVIFKCCVSKSCISRIFGDNRTTRNSESTALLMPTPIIETTAVNIQEMNPISENNK